MVAACESLGSGGVLVTYQADVPFYNSFSDDFDDDDIASKGVDDDAVASKGADDEAK